jgi:hypothetical protein
MTTLKCSQDVILTLTSANNGGVIDSSANAFTLQLLPNDNPYGTVQFPSEMLSVIEPLDSSTPCNITVQRV